MPKKVNFDLITSNPVHFGLAFLSKYFSSPPAKFHFEIGQLAASPYPKIAIAAPRGHSKSTIFCLAEPLRRALVAPDEEYRQVIISATSRFSGKWLKRIADELLTNEMLKACWKIKNTTPWCENEIINFTVNGKSRVIRAIGAGCQYRGEHDEYIAVDDLEDLENVRSETQRQYLDDWFQQTVIGSMTRRTRLRVIGTLIHHYCHLATLVGNPKTLRAPKEGWSTKIYQAVDTSLEDPACAVLWPEYCDRAFLLSQQAEMGKVRFAREMMNDPSPDEAIVFREEWFRERWYEQAPPRTNMSVCMFLDPNGGDDKRKSSDLDYAAIAVCGVVKHEPVPPQGYRAGDIYLLDIVRGKWDFLRILEECYNLYKKWGAASFFYESTQFQAVIGQAFSQYCSERGAYPAVLKMDSISSKEARARSVSNLCTQGRFWLPSSLPMHTRQEFFSFPVVDHDDQVDAIVGALRGIRQFSELWGSQSTQIPEENKVVQTCHTNTFVEELRRANSDYSVDMEGKIRYTGNPKTSIGSIRRDLGSC